MPIVKMDELHEKSRVWVYGADRDISKESEAMLLGAVDEYLGSWAAHGAPLHSARHWDDARFLTIGVDSNMTGASGCSIDGLFRALRALEPSIGASLVTSGLVYYRDRNGQIQSVTRDEFTERGARGEIDGDTEVFDLSVTSLIEWQSRFRSRVADSWHASLLPGPSVVS